MPKKNVTYVQARLLDSDCHTADNRRAVERNEGQASHETFLQASGRTIQSTCSALRSTILYTPTTVGVIYVNVLVF